MTPNRGSPYSVHMKFCAVFGTDLDSLLLLHITFWWRSKHRSPISSNFVVFCKRRSISVHISRCPVKLIFHFFIMRSSVLAFIMQFSPREWNYHS